MRREHFTLDVSDVDWVETDGEPTQPSVTIDFTGPETWLTERLSGPGGEPLGAEETDAALRLQGPVSDADTVGVVSLTNRVTGDFVLELNEDARDVLRFIRAARRYGKAASGDGRYQVTITVDGELFVEYDKRTFLVYDDDGNLLRQHSLIPRDVEL